MVIASVGMAQARPADFPRKPATTLRIEATPQDLPPWRRAGPVARSPVSAPRGEWAVIVASPAGVGLDSGLLFLSIVSSQGRRRTVNGPAADGLSMREQRPGDQSGQTLLPLVAGRF